MTVCTKSLRRQWLYMHAQGTVITTPLGLLDRLAHLRCYVVVQGHAALC
jgi:hypothetical protein